MIPDKIYADGFGIYDEKPIFDENIEYISKSTLLDWLKQSKQEMEEDFKGTDGLKMAMIATAISSFQEVIEKLESL